MMNETHAAIPLSLLLLFLSVFPAAAQQPSPALFPRPLHLVREIDDPISGGTYVVEEFYSGNLAISVDGERVAIADYEAGTLTEIDKAAGTFSIASFEVIADAKRSLAGPARARRGVEPDVDPISVAPKTVAGQVAESLAAEFEEGELRRVEASFSPEIRVTREALDVILGAAYPNEPRRESRVVAALAPRPDKSRASVEAATNFPLPLRQVFVYEIDGESVTLVQRAVAVDDAVPDPALVTVPIDAVRVEPHLVKLNRLLEEMDRLPGRPEESRP